MFNWITLAAVWWIEHRAKGDRDTWKWSCSDSRDTGDLDQSGSCDGEDKDSVWTQFESKISGICFWIGQNVKEIRGKNDYNSYDLSERKTRSTLSWEDLWIVSKENRINFWLLIHILNFWEETQYFCLWALSPQIQD